MSSCLGVEEVSCETHRDQHSKEDKIVFPADGLKSDWVDEGVEEDSYHGTYQCDVEPAGSKVIRPDLAGIRGLERCTVTLVS